MNRATILIIGGDESRTAALVEKLSQKFYILAAENEEDAISRFLQTRFDAVLFTELVSEESKSKLAKLFKFQQQDIAFVEENEGIDIESTITAAIEQQQKENKPSFSFKDDALKNAGLNIEIQ